MFTIDGKNFDGVMSLSRTFTIDEDGLGGRTLTGAVLRSIIGTRYDYTLVIDADGMTKTEYDELYELISAPAVSHQVTMPYGAAEQRSFEAYVTGGEDELQRIDGDGRVWGKLKVQILAIEPQR